jgi:hypothetical protein
LNPFGDNRLLSAGSAGHFIRSGLVGSHEGVQCGPFGAPDSERRLCFPQASLRKFQLDVCARLAGGGEPDGHALDGETQSVCQISRLAGGCQP